MGDAHRRATLAALSTGLQGLHGELRDAGDLVVEGSKLTVTVNSSVESFETESGHFWRLLPAGKQVGEVKGEGFTPVTKLITIVPGDLAVSVIHLERAGTPRLVILSLLVTIFIIGALCYVLCRFDLLISSQSNFDFTSLGMPHAEGSGCGTPILAF